MKNSSMHDERAELRTLGKAVAEHLTGYKVDEQDDSYWQVRLDNPDNGHGLSLSLHKDKVIATGLLPRVASEFTSGVKHGEIGVTAARGPEAIAAEIKRRLLPEYEANFAAVLEKVEKAEAAERRREAVVQRLVDAAPGVSAIGDGTKSAYITNGSIDVNYNAETVSITARSVPVDVAVAVVKLLQASPSE